MSRDPASVTNSDTAHAGAHPRASANDEEGAEGVGAALVDEPVGGTTVEDELRERLAEVESRLRKVSSAYKEAKDEVESTKTRLERNAAVREEYRRGEVVTAVFEPVENLHRSVQSLRQTAPEAAEGLQMVYQQFMTALHGLGLEEMGHAGQTFDPKEHEAISSQPVDDAKADGRVVAVFSKGYRIGSRLIRPARVVIGVYTAPSEPPSE